MPKDMSKEDIIKTQEGTELTVKPLTIRSLRKFMVVMEEMNEYQRETEREQARYERELEAYSDAVADGEEADEPTPPETDDFAVIDYMIRAAKIALEKHNPDFVADEENLEDELDMDVLTKVLEIAGGVQMGDPNLSATPTARAGTAKA